MNEYVNKRQPYSAETCSKIVKMTLSAKTKFLFDTRPGQRRISFLALKRPKLLTVRRKSWQILTVTESLKKVKIIP